MGGPGRWRRRARGRLCAAGDRAAVEHRLRSAHLARAHDVLGRSLPAGERSAAVAALERAAAILEPCGSSWRRRRSLDALRRLGSAGRRAAAAALGPGSLTRREREVARLAATGMSAKDIAGTLFVGERTVESHLASVYAKLGVESKLQLVRRRRGAGALVSRIRTRIRTRPDDAIGVTRLRSPPARPDGRSRARGLADA